MKFYLKKEIIIGALLTVIYFFILFFTNSGYNINWDGADHFIRGQAYLHLFLTGKKNYNDLPNFKEFDKCRCSSSYHYSIYQVGYLDGNHFLKNDSGHPPLNGILASLFNYIFFQRLGVLGDIESYQVFIIAVSVLAAGLVFYWGFKEFGLFAGIISFLSLTLYPLFINESHNNIKDPVESAFFTFTIYAFYKSIRGGNWKWMLLSAVFFGLSLGTKFNVVFLPFYLLPWLIYFYFSKLKKGTFSLKISKAFLFSLIVYPIIGFIIFFGSRPYYWQSPVENILKTVNYYISIGTGGGSIQSEFQFFGFNTYALQFIFFTTPLPILFFLIAGIIFILINYKKSRRPSSVLWLIWFIIPIARVTLPGTSIYGGVRQVMEYLPALALLCGVGAVGLKNLMTSHLKRSNISGYIIPIIIVFMYVPIFWEIKKIHPNESFYFNQFIGGLKGATKKFEVWDTALGNQYMQGIKWINANVEKNSKLIMRWGMMSNIPIIKIRPDISFGNYQESVYKKKGEYIIGLVDVGLTFGYYAQYPERYLVPVHEIKVDGIPVLKIWKNDAAHTKKGYIKEEDITSSSVISVNGDEVYVKLREKKYITSLLISKTSEDCKITGGTVYTSTDNQLWKREVDGLLDVQAANLETIKDGAIIQHLAAVSAQYIKIVALHEPSCFISDYKLRIIALEDIHP